jgi:phosphohistidine phosphatase
MATLLLLRHADAAGSGPSGDHSRPLNARGRDAARLIGAHLASRGQVPDKVLCSSADRAVETWQTVAAELAEPPEADTESALYSADPAAVLSLIAAIPPEVGTLLVVGHNPTLHQLAFGLSAQSNGEALDRLAREFPPGALAEIDFTVDDWSEVTPGAGRLVSLVTPADLV